jgi:hypothetical protein
MEPTAIISLFGQGAYMSGDVGQVVSYPLPLGTPLILSSRPCVNWLTPLPFDVDIPNPARRDLATVWLPVDGGVDGDTDPDCGGSVPPSGHLVGIHQPPFHVKNTRDTKHNLICGLSDVINPVVMFCGTMFHVMANYDWIHFWFWL